MTTPAFRIQLDRKAIAALAGGEDVTRGLELIGQVGEGAAKGFAPVDTGNLRRSITHELGRSGIAQYVRIGTNVEYAIFQELGTRRHEAQPFLRPAVETIRRFVAGSG